VLRRFVLALVLMVVAPLGHAATLKHGTGEPDLADWCAMDWLAGCTTGVVALSGTGLELHPTLSPPPSAYELSLKLIPYRSLLFLLEGRSAVGHVTFYLNGRVLDRIRAQGGRWWVRIDDLPTTGILRLELDQYCESLVIRSINFPCRPCPRPSCLKEFLLGALLGAAVVWIVCIMTQ